MATDRPGRYSNCQSKRKTPADVLTSSSRPPAPSRRAGPVARATADSVPSFPSPPPSPTNHPTPSGHVKDKFGAQARYECQRRARDSLGGGERRGTAGPREGEGGGRGARRRPACAPAPRASRPRPAPRPPRPRRPRRLRPGERARPPRRRPRSPALPRRAPAAPPAPGGGGRALRPRGDPGSPLRCARAGDSHLHPRGPRRQRTSARLNCSWKAPRAPLAGKCPRRPRWGVGKRPPPRFRHLRNSGRFARIRDAPAADTLIKSCHSAFCCGQCQRSEIMDGAIIQTFLGCACSAGLSHRFQTPPHLSGSLPSPSECP